MSSLSFTDVNKGLITDTCDNLNPIHRLEPGLRWISSAYQQKAVFSESPENTAFLHYHPQYSNLLSWNTRTCLPRQFPLEQCCQIKFQIYWNSSFLFHRSVWLTAFIIRYPLRLESTRISNLSASESCFLCPASHRYPRWMTRESSQKPVLPPRRSPGLFKLDDLHSRSHWDGERTKISRALLEHSRTCVDAQGQNHHGVQYDCRPLLFPFHLVEKAGAKVIGPCSTSFYLLLPILVSISTVAGS